MNDIEAKIDLRRLLNALATTGTPDVALDDVRIGKADVTLDVDAAGAPLIARTFHRHVPAVPPPPPPLPLPPGPFSRAKPEPRVTIGKVAIGQAHVHGSLVPPALDGDAADLRGVFRFENKKATITLDQSCVTLRSPQIPNQRAPLIGTAHGVLGVDVRGERSILDGNVKVEGTCGTLPVIAEAKLEGDRLDATVDIARTDRQQSPRPSPVFR